MTCNRRDLRVHFRRGFTLIEVLIAVLVLSLGLLGLAAVFPAVIAQQRNAVDRTQGAIVAKVVEQTLEGGQFLVNFRGLRRDFWFSADTQLGCGGGFDLDPYLNGNPNSPAMNFLWQPTWAWGPSGHVVGSSYIGTGVISVGAGKYLDFDCIVQTPDVDSLSDNDKWDEPYFIPVTARLFPQPFTGEEPRYVWDFIARRTRVGGDSTGLELAVFIRRLDPRIRVPRGRTLSDVLTPGRVSGSEFRFPVAMDPATGLPSGDGVGVYSVPMTLPVIVRSVIAGGSLDELVLDGGASSGERDLWRRVVATPGQILVDNLGNVVNVVRVPEQRTGEPLRVVVDHVYAQAESDYSPGSNLPRGVQVEQILFTGQKPVRVFTFRADW
jgi:prepilin-type N-terminal cleavage/methylation domain-containing protein